MRHEMVFVGAAISIPGVGRFVFGSTPEESARALAMKRTMVHPLGYSIGELLADHPELNESAVWAETVRQVEWWNREPDA